MATHHTGCTILSLSDRNGVRPGAKGDFGTNMLRLDTGVGIMAGHTVAALLHIYMEIMQVVFAIPEICQGLGELLLGYILVVAAKTKLIVFRPILCIKLFREILVENPSVLRAMDIMTGHTVTCLDRSMAEITSRYIVGQLIVAGKTQLLGAFL